MFLENREENSRKEESAGESPIPSTIKEKQDNFDQPEQMPEETREDCVVLESSDVVYEAKVQELEKEVLLKLAEIQNLEKRHRNECQTIRQYAITAFARELLGVLDDMNRALAFKPVEDDMDSSLKMVWDGIEMTRKNLLGVVGRFGIQSMDVLGKDFDPRYHEALGEEESDVYGKGMISSVLQDGYYLNDRLLRPALVKISKGAESHQVNEV
jgi:molecular chaperone GrpE